MEKKASLLAVLEILKDTDENNILSEKEFSNKLLNKYDIKIDRRTFYSNIELLESFDYDISKPKDNGKGYYLYNRDFEESEINLLSNAIHSSKFIPKSYSDDLVKKLLHTQSKTFRKEFNDEVFLDNGLEKKENKDFFLNIDSISYCIRKKISISFDYMRYDINKKLIKRDGDRRILSPHHLVYTNDKVYLIGYSPLHKQVIHLRVDKIMNVKQEIDIPYIQEKKKNDPYQYIKTKLYMFAGDDLRVTIRFKKSILDDIIDSFGKSIHIYEDGDEYCRTTITSSKQGVIYFALQYLENIEIIDPIDLRKEIYSILKQGLVKYK